MPLFAYSVAIATLMLSFSSVPARADSLSGAWSGNGSVHYSRSRERARCNARFSRVSGTLYKMNATCATPSGRVVQTATVNRVGANEYAGKFRNPQYNITGSISIKLHGSTQYVRLVGDGGGSGSFKMRRR